jgi:8-oxo-dGTP pyrophosphatase MutT (NUDIX family)
VSLHARTTSLLSAYSGQPATRAAMLAFLADVPEACFRSFVPGHITATMMVVNPTRDAVLLTLHRRFELWLPPGGHCEPADVSPLSAAAREATEETGIASLVVDPEPLHLRVIQPVTCSLGIPTRHLDIRFLAVAPDTQPVTSPESLDVAWFATDELPRPLGSDVAALVEMAVSGRRAP